MDTIETAQRTKAAYFIEYVYPVDAYGKQSFYFQLVRTKDCAILYANENINNVFIACWKMDISHMVTDELGAVRHAMTAKELDDLYKRLENFIADCTRSEVDANRDAINKVQSMIHQRMRLTKK